MKHYGILKASVQACRYINCWEGRVGLLWIVMRMPTGSPEAVADDVKKYMSEVIVISVYSREV
jgi:hypothetical protein